MGDARQVGAAFVKAFNAHDERRIRDLSAENATFEAPGEIQLEGADALTGYAMSWLNAFPDARVSVRNEVAAGDWVVQEFTFEGTHENTLAGPAGDIPATNRRLTGRGVQTLRVERDKLAEAHLYFDQVQVMTQLGLMPEAATA
jgi:predicted ester cyclase